MELDNAVRDDRIVARYRRHVVTDPACACSFWVGAISGRGHGRFWIAPGRVVIAHRFGYVLGNGPGSLEPRQVLAHICDEPLCQNPDHLTHSSNSDNTDQWSRRRHHFAGPLADPRGARGRALALRELLGAGVRIPAALAQQHNELEAGQLSLFPLDADHDLLTGAEGHDSPQTRT